MESSKQIIIDTLNRQVPLGDIYGIFFEDLNHAADGGLYAELVQNRSFEFDPIDNKNYHALTAWDKVEKEGAQASIWVESTSSLNEKNKNYLGVEVQEVGNGAGFLNKGFNSGIALAENEAYDFSFYARTKHNKSIEIEISLMNDEGICYSKESMVVEGTEWKQYCTEFTAAGTDYSARLVILIKETGVLYFDMISLFPRNTYKGRKNGLRADIAKKLEELKPKFMRFPGGCLVHDGSLSSEDRNSMYRWKNTIGNVEQRPARRNNWGYNQTLGLGYYEYFLLCEDIGAKAIPVIPGGYDPHHGRIVPIEELGPWIDDALDLIEFANGDINTTWGKKRAELGHPEPFQLEYIGVGNEEVGEPFFERYPYFHRAIKDKYPAIKIINSSGPFAAGSEYDRGWNSAKEHKSDLVDEHYYQSPEWFLANYHRYDNFKAEEPKVFLGEYASWGNTYYNALVEAAFMTGLEKNAHAIGLACYAPMLCNADYVNWQPDMIWFNNHEIYATPNYYVQKLFMNHQGEYLLNTTWSGLNEVTKTEVQAINGMISIFSKGVRSSFHSIVYKDLVSGKELYADTMDLDIDEIKELFQTDSVHYRLTLKGIRKSGARGLEIFFGETDNKNRLIWEIGGWQNQD
ncbi:MAG: alpha-L-arabinofuranosidase domain protein, partial [Anaerocolumna sp.]|nr:alpha-L-arabinofuranosidase domain protein [Anaerocolumna sp.]